MKNKLFSVCLVLAMFFLCLPVLPQADAADEWKTGYLSNLAVQPFFEKQVIALLYDTNGQRQQYTFAERVVLINETNSKNYNNAQDLYDALTAYKNTCCQFLLDADGRN